ncbi:hypothetical protein BJI46_06710 [Acinetobacter qingfengensis]|uniref:Uncharacterized protein n=2 Tax=Acinetobacter qingfengensis TaxID=1262585 RepID=A0A1E7QWE2_9GAMM|nr:hypothetical protein BJI46_06710 [Acinetobacter qingfengensis]
MKKSNSTLINSNIVSDLGFVKFMLKLFAGASLGGSGTGTPPISNPGENDDKKPQSMQKYYIKKHYEVISGPCLI